MHLLNAVPGRLFRRIFTPVLALLVFMIPAACSVFGGASVEEAAYELVTKDDQFEIRDYAAVVVAETSVDGRNGNAGNRAFRTLFDYISGENEASAKIAMTSPVFSEPTTSTTSNEKIAMTAPVMYQRDGSAWRYQFVLPRSYTLDSTPRPLNPDVTLAVIAPRRVATVRYAWLATDKAREKNAKALLDWVDSQGLVLRSEPRWAGYNPPWTLPPFRRNEVLVDISD